MAALAFMTGVGPDFLAAQFPDDVAIYAAIAERADKFREQERKHQAVEIANAVGKMLDG